MNRGMRWCLAALSALSMSSVVARAQGPDVPEDKSWAFSYNDHAFAAGSEIDLRSMNEKIAGEHGFIGRSADKQSFVRGDGQPIRFWAYNPDIKLPQAQLETEARFLSGLGVNMVRFLVQISAPSKAGKPIDAFSPQAIDSIWRAEAAFKKEGIYCTICPYWSAPPFMQVPESWGLEGGAHGDAMGMLFFNPKLQDAYKAWVKALYQPKNPYTGIPLAEDPAVAIIQIQNEDSLYFYTVNGMPAAQQEVLGGQFADWLAKKYGSLDAATKRWEGDKEKGDDFANKKIGLMVMWRLGTDLKGGAHARASDQVEFFADTERKFYTDMVDYYHHTLNCKQLINCSNWITADPIRLGDDERYANEPGEVMAINHYYTPLHTGAPGLKAWRTDPGDTYVDPSATLDIRNLPCNFRQVVGYPFIDTESNWMNPVSHQSEGPPLIAAYESLSGMSGYYWFDSMGPEYCTNPYFQYQKVQGQLPYFNYTANKPEVIGMFPAAALMFRKGYIEQGATPAIHEERSLADMWAEKLPLIAEDASFEPTRWAGQSGSEEENIKGGINPLAYLVGRVEVKYDGIPTHSTAIDFSKYVDSEHKIIHSITGQITMNYGIGLCTVDAPKAVEAVGFLAKTGPLQIGAVTIDSKNDYASICVVPLDDAPIGTSSKVLVQVGTWGRPTGWTSEPAMVKARSGPPQQGFKLINTGHMPERLMNTEVTISVKNAHLSKAELLDTAGYPEKAIEGKSADGVFTVTLPADAMYVVLQ